MKQKNIKRAEQQEENWGKGNDSKTTKNKAATSSNINRTKTNEINTNELNNNPTASESREISRGGEFEPKS